MLVKKGGTVAPFTPSPPPTGSAFGIHEQLIMSRTGHRSVDGVCVYKRICEEQKQELPDVLNNGGEEKKWKFFYRDTLGFFRGVRQNAIILRSFG